MNRTRILYVDDEPDLREVVELCLGLEPMMEARCCASGQEALDQVKTWLPDLVLSDLMMPEMNGRGLLERLRKNPQTEGIVFIFLTARAQAKEIESLLALGANGVISKPFDPIGLASHLRKSFLTSKISLAGVGFRQRLKTDRDIINGYRDGRLTKDFSKLEFLQSCAHKLAGAAGIFGLSDVSDSARQLENLLISYCSKRASLQDIEQSIGALIACIDDLIPNVSEQTADEDAVAII